MRKIAFFSGGSALTTVARELAARCEPVSYLITTFDSGGSTQAIRKVFAIPAIGDLRNRLLAAADAKAARTVAFLKSRVGRGKSKTEAREELFAAINGADWSVIPEAAKIRADLDAFLFAMPPEFDPANASLGNLALAGAWLRNGGDLEAALERYRRILHSVASILPITTENLHLGAVLDNGEVILGQHRFNNRLTGYVARIFLTRQSPWRQGEIVETRPEISAGAREALAKAEVVCFPTGSFYSSLLSNLLPGGVGRVIAKSRAPKVFIPNSGLDPEQRDLDIVGQAKKIIDALQADLPEGEHGKFIDYVLGDSANGDYPGGFGPDVKKMLADLGVKALDAPIVAAPGKHDPVVLINELESLA